MLPHILALPMLIWAATGAGAEMLPGSEWGPAALKGETFEPHAEIFLRFEEDAVYVGHGGCNGFRGRFVTNGDAILFSPAAATRKACPEPVAQQENDFFAALAAARHFVRDGTQLTISGEDGAPLMELAQRDAD